MAFWDETEPGWDTGQAFDVPRTPDVIPVDIGQAGQDVSTSGTNSAWGGIGDLLSKVTNYAITRDAQKQALQLQAQRQALGLQPVVGTVNGGVGINPSMLMLGVVVLGGLYLLSHGGKGG